jgi:hypothetical protein
MALNVMNSIVKVLFVRRSGQGAAHAITLDEPPMGLRDKLDEMRRRAQRELAERAAKAAADRTKEAAVSAFEGAKKKIGDALFGNAVDDDRQESERGADRARQARDAREDDAGRKLREAAARQADRVASERTRLDRERREEEARAARARAAAETEKQIDDELAALKKKIGK